MNSMIIVVTICAMFITFSEADVERGDFPRNLGYKPFLEYVDDACFLLDFKNYSVRGMGLDSPQISGCAYINRREVSEGVKKTFTLWFGNSYYNGRQPCGRDGTYVGDYTGMVKIIFPCMEVSPSLENPEDRTKYLRLNGEDTNKDGVESTRCALFEKDDVGSEMFRLAISSDQSCGDLSRILTQIFPSIPKGAKLLRLTREP